MFPRQKHLLEQFTSNSCTYCPLGTSMIEILQTTRDDIARVAIHGNMNSVDPTNTAQCDTIFAYVGCGGWPYGTFDRMTGWESDDAIANGLGYDATYHDQVATELSSFFDEIAANMPSFATINLESEINPLTREATVVVSGEMTEDFDVMMGEDAKLTVYLTEDSIIYRQLNKPMCATCSSLRKSLPCRLPASTTWRSTCGSWARPANTSSKATSPLGNGRCSTMFR